MRAVIPCVQALYFELFFPRPCEDRAIAGILPVDLCPLGLALPLEPRFGPGFRLFDRHDGRALPFVAIPMSSKQRDLN